MWDGISLDGHFNCCWLNWNYECVYCFLNQLCGAFNNVVRCNWCSQHLFKHPCFIGICIFHHEISCMGRVEYWSWTKESCNHVIQASLEASREVEFFYIWNVHGPIFFVMSSNCHVIIDSLVVSNMEHHLPLYISPFLRWIAEPKFITYFDIFFHLIIVISNWSCASSLLRFARCFSFFDSRAKTLTCFQFDYHGFLDCTSTKSKF